jgi:membrane protein YdbS with pleckstrin-like domain
VTDTSKSNETVRWKAYPAWAHFTWLYLFSLIAAVRGIRLLIFGQAAAAVWLVGALALLVCVVVLRRWAQYVLSSRRIIVRNGYTGHDIDALALDAISDVSIKQGPIARFFNIGTIVVQSATGDRTLWLRGVAEADMVKTRIQAAREPTLS